MVCGIIFKTLFIKARKLKFLDNIHYHLCVMCQMSRHTCHMSRVKCPKKQRQKKTDNLVELVGGGFVIIWAYPV